jgi:hypothetical protein
MKLRDSGLDDLLNELLYVLDQDGGPLARAVRWLLVRTYRLLRNGILMVLRLPWHTERQPYPEPGHEPFNLPPDELERHWGQP